MKYFIYPLLILLLSCSDKSNEQDLIVGTSADNNPYELVQNGEVTGFDIDLIKEIGKNLNKKVIIKDMNFNGLIPSLLTNDIDLAIAGISATDSRNESVDFSIPYSQQNISILSKENLKLQSLNDLENKTIGAQLGTTWHQKALDIASEVPGVKIKALSNNLLLVEEVKAGNLDAVILETSQVHKFTSLYNNLNKFDLDNAGNSLSIAFPKGSKLKNRIDQIILKLEQTGYLESLRQKWFN
jgi:polar amino acid transport system substrate-binding protein